MGRTNPTYRDRLSRLERDWREYRRALRVDDQPQFDRLFEHGRTYAHAAGNLNHPTPAIPFLLSVLLAHEREITRLSARLDELDTHTQDDGLTGNQATEPTTDGVQD